MNFNFEDMAKKMFWLAVLMPVLVILFYNISFIIPFFNGIMDLKGVNEVGDFLGGTMTPFLTIAAFFLLLQANKIQNEALTTSKEELELSRQEMAKSTQALEDQRKIMRQEMDNNQEKRELDTFFILYKNWRSFAEQHMFKRHFGNRVVIKDGHVYYELNSSAFKDDVLPATEYGKHLRACVSLCEGAEYFGILTGINKNEGWQEYEFIHENLETNGLPLIKVFNTLCYFIDNCQSYPSNKLLMKKIVLSSMSFGEKYIFSMAVSDFIIGDISKSDEYIQLKHNMENIGALLPNNDGKSEQFHKNIENAITRNSIYGK